LGLQFFARIWKGLKGCWIEATEWDFTAAKEILVAAVAELARDELAVFPAAVITSILTSGSCVD